MPEAPELEVIRDFLSPRIVGKQVVAARVARPSVLRPLAGDFEVDIVGRAFESIDRVGKMLLFGLSGDRKVALNMMLSGLLQYSGPGERVLKITCFAIVLSSGDELRYLDDKQMGKAYYATGGQLSGIPRFAEMAGEVPDVLDQLSLAEMKERLRPLTGEIKGILTRGRVVAGVGNAYADEILFDAKIYPFKKRAELTDEDLERLRLSMPRVIAEATEEVRRRTGDQIHRKRRDFMKVHRKGGAGCPTCAGRISEVTANRRVTSYYPGCQPGMLIDN